MQVVLVFPLLLLLTAFLSWFAGYATYCFFHVLNETAQGRNDVPIRWPIDGFYERLWNAVYLATLAAVSLLPGLLLVRLLGLETETRLLLIVLVIAAVVWFLLPVPLLSVLSGRGHWEIFRWKVLRALAHSAAMAGAFLGASAPLIIGGLLIIHFAVAGWIELREDATASALSWLPSALEFWSWFLVLPLAGAYCAAGLLIYARLLGRLAWMLDLAEVEEEEPSPDKAIPAPAHLAASHDALEPVAPETPTSVETYGLLDEGPPSALPAGPIPERVMPAPSLAVAAQRLAAPLPVSPLPERVQPSPILELPVKAPGPRRLLVRGIFLFPWYRASLVAWFVLTGGFLIALLLARLMFLVLH